MTVKPKPPFGLRLPDDLRQWIKDQAAKNGSSQNSEIIRAIRAHKERIEPTTT